MYNSRFSTVLKTFVYAIVILVIVSSGLATLGFMFADQLSFLPFPVVDVCMKLCTVSTVLLVIHLITFGLVMILQLRRLTDWFGYIVLSLFAIVSYIEAWFTTPELFEFSKNLFGF
jgi:hypothetical protein